MWNHYSRLNSKNPVAVTNRKPLLHRIRKKYINLATELREKTKELPFEEADQFLETVNLLCSEYEYEAYVEGVKIGIRLMCELMA